MRSYGPGDEPIPGYRLIEPLGQGSFGVVWQAEGPGGVLVALKIISNLNGMHAIREWQSLQNVMNLKQANLVEIYGVWLKNEEDQVLRAEEVRALIPADVVAGTAPVTETSSAPPAVPRKSVWSGDKKSSKPTAAGHKLETATLQPDDEPPTAGGQAGSTAADSKGSSESPSAGTDRSGAKSVGTVKEGAGSKDSTLSKDPVAAGSPGKSSGSGGRAPLFPESRDGRVPPLELVSAMTLGEGTLMSRLKQCQAQGSRGIPRPELLRYMLEAAKGLQYLNDRKMHHCDVKPENLLLVGGSVKVCDYGSALRTIYSAESRTHQGYTEQYAAPEQLSGRKVKLHTATDLYALALTYYALRTGKYPWGDLSTEPISVVKYGEKFDFSALSKLSRYPYEWQVIRRALKRDPEERFASTMEFTETLEKAARREEEATRARRRRRIRNVLLIAAALLMAGVGIGAWVNRDKLPSWIYFKSNEDEFKALASGTPDELIKAVDVVNQARPALNSKIVTERVVDGLAKTRDKSPDRLQVVIEKVLTLKEPYRPTLKGAVADASGQLFQTKFEKQIATYEYEPVLAAVTAHRGLQAWDLPQEVQSRLVKQWLDSEHSKLAAAAPDPAKAKESVRPLAALANALAKDPQRQAEIDGAVTSQLGTWREAGDELLADDANLSRARDEFRRIAASADGYAEARSAAPASFRSLAAEAKVGEVAARYLLKNEPPSELAKALEQAGGGGSQDSPTLQARRILLRRALGKRDDPQLVGDLFLSEELPQLRKLPAAWEQQTLDQIKSWAFEVATDLEKKGLLTNRDEVSRALADDRLMLQFAHGALAGEVADQAALTSALAEARRQLDQLPKTIDRQADSQARDALAAWLALLESDAPTPAQLAAGLQAFERWASAIAGDARVETWFLDFAASIAQRPRRWPKEVLSSAIADVESSATGSSSRLDGSLIGLALRSQRLLTLAIEPALSDADLLLIQDDSGRLMKARSDDADGVVGRFVTPAILVDTLWAESHLAPLALSSGGGQPLPPDVKAALDRLTAHLKEPPAAAGPNDSFAASYLRYVADVNRAITRPPGEDLGKVLPPPQENDVWLKPDLRHNVAAALLLELAEAAGKTPAFSRGTNLANFRDTFARQIPRLSGARQWAVAGTRQQVAADGRTALALFYSSGEPHDWQSIRAASQPALAAADVCQMVVSREQFSHLLLIHADALRNSAGTEDKSAVIGILADVLERECNPYDGNKGCFTDRELYERAIQPALALSGDQSPAELKVSPVDLAVVRGSLGTLLERDTNRQLAVDHYEFNTNPNLVVEAMLGAFQMASRSDDDPQRKLRWLAGEAMALDRSAELPQVQYADLAMSLTSVASRMEDIDKDYFAAAAVRGLAAFYSAPKVNDLADLARGEKQRSAALDDFRKSLAAIETDRNADSPWCHTWQATIRRLASHVCLQQSWSLPWGAEMQAKLQEAIQLAEQAKRDAPDPLERAQASSTLGNAYEDLAFYLKCVSFYKRAEAEFELARKGVEGFDPYQELLFRRNLIRVRYRRLGHDDPSLTAADRQAWKTELPAAMRDLLKDMAARRLDRYQTFTEFWLADMLSAPTEASSEALDEAEKLYKKIPADASPTATAKRWYLAADCAWRLAIETNSDEAVNRTRGYLQQILPLEKDLSEASLRSEIAQLRGEVAADRWDNNEDARFEEFVSERTRGSAAIGLAPAEATRLRIRLHLMVGKSLCESKANFATRKAAIDEALRLLRDERAQLDEREYVTLLLRGTAQSLQCQVDSGAKLPTGELLALVKTALEAARQAEARIGQVDCCASPTDTPAPVKGFDSVIESQSLRLMLADRLIQPIYFDEQKPNQVKIDELTWIKAQLDELKKALPQEGERAVKTRATIDNKHLRDLGRFLNQLRQAK